MVTVTHTFAQPIRCLYDKKLPPRVFSFSWVVIGGVAVLCLACQEKESGNEGRMVEVVGEWKKGKGCQKAKFDPFLSLDFAGVEGVGAQSKKGRYQILQRSTAEP